MAFTTLDQLLTAKRVTLRFRKIAVTYAASVNHNFFVTPLPWAMSWTSGIKVDTPGEFPVIPDPAEGKDWYVTDVRIDSASLHHVILVDLIWLGTFHATTGSTIAHNSPDISVQAEFKWDEVEAWMFDPTTAVGTIANIAGTWDYVNQDGVTRTGVAFTTGPVNSPAMAFRLPLAQGDTGVRQILSVTTGNTGSELVPALLRRICALPNYGNLGGVHTPAIYGPLSTGLPKIRSDAAIGYLMSNNSNSIPDRDIIITIAEG